MRHLSNQEIANALNDPGAIIRYLEAWRVYVDAVERDLVVGADPDHFPGKWIEVDARFGMHTMSLNRGFRIGEVMYAMDRDLDRMEDIMRDIDDDERTRIAISERRNPASS